VARHRSEPRLTDYLALRRSLIWRNLGSPSSRPDGLTALPAEIGPEQQIQLPYRFPMQSRGNMALCIQGDGDGAVTEEVLDQLGVDSYLK
jgi:hypothetical protein